MGTREIIKEYTNGDLTVVWKPQKCIHAAVCVSMLPEVYDPKKKPWIVAENASVDELKAQINKCPSAALTYKMKNEEKENLKPEIMTKIAVNQNGPLLVHGDIELTNADGTTEIKTRVTAFCRCGASGNKPYCDGEHNKIEFKG